METFLRVWCQDKSLDTKAYQDTITFYDGGDFTGMLLQTKQGKQWSGYHILERKHQDATSFTEILRPAHDFFVPLGFFSIETYACRVQGSTLWIPGWKISLQPHVQSASDFPLQGHQQQPQTLRPKQRMPGPPLCPPLPLPSSLPPLKLPSETPAPSPRPLQNNHKNAAKQKALPSSSPTFRGKPKSSVQEKLEGSPSPSSPVDHIVRQSQWHPLFQVSLSPLLRAGSEGSNPPPTSSSPNPTNSGQNLPSRQVQHRHANKTQRPSSSKQISHAQIAPTPVNPF